MGKGIQAFYSVFNHIPYRLVGVKCRMRCDDHIGEGTQNGHIVVGDGLVHTVQIIKSCFVFNNVQPCRADFSAFQTADEGVGVHQRAPGPC